MGVGVSGSCHAPGWSWLSLSPHCALACPRVWHCICPCTVTCHPLVTGTAVGLGLSSLTPTRGIGTVPAEHRESLLQSQPIRAQGIPHPFFCLFVFFNSSQLECRESLLFAPCELEQRDCSSLRAATDQSSRIFFWCKSIRTQGILLAEGCSQAEQRDPLPLLQ